jgi:hypothetical protein
MRRIRRFASRTTRNLQARPRQRQEIKISCQQLPQEQASSAKTLKAPNDSAH